MDLTDIFVRICILVWVPCHEELNHGLDELFLVIFVDRATGNLTDDFSFIVFNILDPMFLPAVN